MEEPVEEITEQSLLGNVNVAPTNVVNGTPNNTNGVIEPANVVNIPEENSTNENQNKNKENNKENKKNNKKNKNTPILYNAESEEIVYKNIQNLSPNNLYQGTTRIFQNNSNKNKTRFRHQRRKNKGRTTRKTRIRK